jgi:hypothetical protein
MTDHSLGYALGGLHDGLLKSITVDEGRATLGLTDIDGQWFALELGGVEALCVDGFREANIIFEILVTTGPNFEDAGLSDGDVLASLEVLFRRPHQLAPPKYHAEYDTFREKQLARLKNGTARLVVADTAYGADLVAYCTSIELISKADPGETRS